MINLLDFQGFSIQEKKRAEPHPYFKGLSKSTIEAKKRAMKKQTEMSDSDPSAYKPLPGDKKGKGHLRKGEHTKRYEEMY